VLIIIVLLTPTGGPLLMVSLVLAHNTSQSLPTILQTPVALEFSIQNVLITNLSTSIEFSLGPNPIPPFA
jgi:hypothetical protein